MYIVILCQNPSSELKKNINSKIFHNLQTHIVLDSTNKTASIKFLLVFWGFENYTKKTRQSERLQGTNGYW